MTDGSAVRPERRIVSSAHRFPRHAHAAWSFAVVLGGVGYFRSGGTLHQAAAGAVTVLHPGESHDGWTHTDDGLDYLVVTVDEAVAERWHGRAGTPYFPDRVILDRAFAAGVRAACRAVREGQLAAALAGFFARHARGGRVADGHSPVTAVVRQYIHDHYAEPVSLGALAALVGVSPATLVRRFRAETGIAPYEYLVSRRVDAAMTLLRAGRSVTGTAAATGFADQSHLHRHFRRIVGVTPGRFRGAA